MRVITNVTTPFTPPPPQGAGLNASSGQPGASFPISTLARSPAQLPSQNLSGTASPSLGAQTAAALLQMQDLDQAQAHGGGGGGGHHGGMKMMPGLELEEAVGDEEAQLVRQRKKLMKMKKSSEESGAAEVDDNGVALTTDADPNEENQGAGRNNKNALDGF